MFADLFGVFLFQVVRYEKLNRKLQLDLNNELHEKQVKSQKVRHVSLFNRFQDIHKLTRNTYS